MLWFLPDSVLLCVSVSHGALHLAGFISTLNPSVYWTGFLSEQGEKREGEKDREKGRERVREREQDIQRERMREGQTEIETNCLP